MLMYRAHATSAYLPTCLLPTPAASIGTAAGTAAVGVGRAWRCDSVLDLPLPILRHRPLKDPMVIHQVRLLCAAEAAHLRRGSGAWERSAEGGEASPLLPLSLAHFPRRRSSALALLCTGGSSALAARLLSLGVLDHPDEPAGVRGCAWGREVCTSAGLCAWV